MQEKPIKMTAKNAIQSAELAPTSWITITMNFFALHALLATIHKK